MTKKYLDFEIEIPKDDQDFHIRNTWCDHCNKADLGLTDPRVYIENHRKYIEGKCRGCNDDIVSEIIYK